LRKKATRKAEDKYAKDPFKVKRKPTCECWIDTDTNEIKGFFSLLIHRGMTPGPNYPFYWQNNPKDRNNWIAEVMTRSRFFELKQLIY